ncbi:MAG: glycoside hydrolase family 3 C-terminal domain-containing protein [Prevotella sp.]|nr:glycoside hydrolase family 3 C-terminal domain-containing protein [Prevotella sp.]
MKQTILTIVMAVGCVAASAQLRLTEDNIKEVVAAMTLEEKAAFVVGTQRGGVYPPPPAPGMPVRPADDPLNNEAAKRKQQLVDGKAERDPNAVTAFSEGRVRGAAGDVLPIERLGITTMVLADGPAGLRIDPKRPDDEQTYYCTAFPTASLLAATWDVPLVERMAQAMGNEVREYGVDVLLAPGMNIMRNPLCGRNYEYFSEDPLLAGKLAAAYIRGIQSQGVGVSLKYFAVNNQETYRNGIDVCIDERTLREIYLRGFEIAVKEGQPWTIMSSYNKINGTLASENRWLLKDVLREEWGFLGFVMTDWWAEENGARQIAAGNDMLMPGTQRQMNEILESIGNGTLSEDDLDWCVENILRVLVQSPSFQRYAYSNQPDLDAHAQVAREVAAEGMVLLKNAKRINPENKRKSISVLPLDKRQKVALLGVDSYDALVGGSGSGHVNRKYEVSIYEGLLSAGFSIDDEWKNTYLDYIAAEKAKQGESFFWIVPTIAELSISKEQAKQLALHNDVCIFTIGRMAGEGEDRRLEKGDYYLSSLEWQNLNNICAAFHSQQKPVIVLLSMGNHIDMASWHHLPDAILHTWLPRQEEGHAITDVLTGRISPSGKLPFTIAARYEDYSSAANFPYSNGNPAEVEYKEGIFVGYRHFDSQGIEATYPFGYGLSYTTFHYSKIRLSAKKMSAEGAISAEVKVTNTGNRAGKEVVQLYIGDDQCSVSRPLKELKDFKKVTLRAGETKTVSFTITPKDLQYYDNGWKTEPGRFTIYIGSSSKDIRCKNTFTLE